MKAEQGVRNDRRKIKKTKKEKNMKNEELLVILKKERPTLNDVETAFKEYERRINILEKINNKIEKETKGTPLNNLLKNSFRDPLKYEEAEKFDIEDYFKKLLLAEDFDTISQSLQIINKWEDGDLKRKWYEFKIDMKKGLPEIAADRVIEFLKTCDITNGNVNIFYDIARELEESNERTHAVDIYKDIIKRNITYKDVIERYKALKQSDSSHGQTPISKTPTPRSSTPHKITPLSKNNEESYDSTIDKTIEGSSISGERYVLLRRIGSGGMGEVYEAKDTKLGRRVAVKMMKDEISFRRREKERFLREARTSAKLSHPNIVSIFDIVDEEEKLYLVLEYVDGKRLADIIDEKEKIGEKMAKSLTMDVLKSLSYAHQQGVIHRDIKPTNVMVTSDWKAKLLDFGIAREAYNTMMSMSMNTSGTPAYMAPEQHLGDKVDESTDIYGVGAMLYEMLTGETPFKGTDLHLVKREKKVNLEAVSNEKLRAIISKCLEPEREKRYRKADEMIEDIKKA